MKQFLAIFSILYILILNMSLLQAQIIDIDEPTDKYAGFQKYRLHDDVLVEYLEDGKFGSRSKSRSSLAVPNCTYIELKTGLNESDTPLKVGPVFNTYPNPGSYPHRLYKYLNKKRQRFIERFF